MQRSWQDNQGHVMFYATTPSSNPFREGNALRRGPAEAGSIGKGHPVARRLREPAVGSDSAFELVRPIAPNTRESHERFQYVESGTSNERSAVNAARQNRRTTSAVTNTRDPDGPAGVPA